MIDIHCHILPGIDDGPASIDESLDMCRIAAADGIRTIVATPHFKPGTYQPSSNEVIEKGKQLQKAVKQEGIGISILLGADVTVTPELPQYLASIEHITINRTKRYFLAEFPHDSVPPKWDSFLLAIKRSGVTPILTHPERNPWFLSHREALYPYVRAGGMVQITAMSITAPAGEPIRYFCDFLLRHDLVHVIASDAHAREGRAPRLADSVAAARAIVGKEKAAALVTTIPEAIIAGRDFMLAEPIMDFEVEEKKTWLRRLASF